MSDLFIYFGNLIPPSAHMELYYTYTHKIRRGGVARAEMVGSGWYHHKVRVCALCPMRWLSLEFSWEDFLHFIQPTTSSARPLYRFQMEITTDICVLKEPIRK